MTARSTAYRSSSMWCWVLQVVLAAFYLMASMPKFSTDPQYVAAYAALGFDTLGTYLIGILEIAAAIGMLIPRICGAAATALVVHMLIATVISGIRLGPETIVLPAACAAVVAVVAWRRRRGTARLVADILSMLNALSAPTRRRSGARG
ncbi:DoxX family protein [Pseudonocardia sp. TRM90224]|uniref:DoxX family protein n=1 Tax=Pseudonocardia sp. TRM90224 TaxID=2812678 RepID=UPI001E2888FC|nr:DoxX family protein [Pseudonocardia sp. TRM90224]